MPTILAGGTLLLAVIYLIRISMEAVIFNAAENPLFEIDPEMYR